MKFSLFNQPLLIGLDIQADGLRWVQLRQKRQEVVLLRAVLDALSHPLFEEAKIKHWGRLCEALSSRVEKWGIQGMSAAISLPFQMVREQRILLPIEMSEQEREKEIQVRLQRELSGMSEPLCMDFATVGAGPVGQDDVFYVATREEYLLRLVDCVNAAGLVVKAVDVDVYALRRATYFVSDALVSVYLRADSAIVLLSNQNNQVQHRHWRFNSMNQFVSELQRYVNLQSISGHHKIAIYGAEKDCQMLDLALEQGWEITREYPDIFLKLERVEGCELNLEESNPSDYLIACGLAMRRVPAW